MTRVLALALFLGGCAGGGANDDEPTDTGASDTGTTSEDERLLALWTEPAVEGGNPELFGITVGGETVALSPGESAGSPVISREHDLLIRGARTTDSEYSVMPVVQPLSAGATATPIVTLEENEYMALAPSDVALSPDGTQIIFHGMPQGTRMLYQAAVDGSDFVDHQTMLFEYDAALYWSGDSAWFALQDQGRIVVFDADTGASQQVHDGGSAPAGVAFDPSGGGLKWSDAAGTHLYDPVADTTTTLTTGTYGSQPSGASWAPDGGTLFVWDRASSSQAEAFLVDGEGQGRTVVDSTLTREPDLAWSPDGSRAVLTHAGTSRMMSRAGVLSDLPQGIAGTPAWSSTGSHVAFSRFGQPVQVTDGTAQFELSPTLGDFYGFVGWLGPDHVVVETSGDVADPRELEVLSLPAQRGVHQLGEWVQNALDNLDPCYELDTQAAVPVRVYRVVSNDGIARHFVYVAVRVANQSDEACEGVEDGYCANSVFNVDEFWECGGEIQPVFQPLAQRSVELLMDVNQWYD